MMRASRMYQKISKNGKYCWFPGSEDKDVPCFPGSQSTGQPRSTPKKPCPSLAKVQNPHPVQQNPMTAFTQEVTQAGRNMPKLGTMMTCVNPTQQKAPVLDGWTSLVSPQWHPGETRSSSSLGDRSGGTAGFGGFTTEDAVWSKPLSQHWFLIYMMLFSKPHPD